MDLWRDVALIILAIQLFVLLLVPLAVLFLTVKGINAVHSRVPPLIQQAQGYSRRMRTRTAEASLWAAQPVLRAEGRARQWATILQVLWQGSSRVIGQQERER